jgi:hypothetical protein
MSCKACASEQQLDGLAELNFILPGSGRLNLSSVFFSHKILVCLNCGYAELVIPAPHLEQLKHETVESLWQ